MSGWLVGGLELWDLGVGCWKSKARLSDRPTCRLARLLSNPAIRQPDNSSNNQGRGGEQSVGKQANKHAEKQAIQPRKSHRATPTTPRHATPRHDIPRHATPRHAMPGHGTPRHGTARRGIARHRTARHSAARHGTARHGTARHSTAPHGTARHGTARHGTARHGAARLTTARHGIHVCPSTALGGGPIPWACRRPG